jgi:hypothetical protein
MVAFRSAKERAFRMVAFRSAKERAFLMPPQQGAVLFRRAKGDQNTFDTTQR